MTDERQALPVVPGDPAVEAMAAAICPGEYCEAHEDCREDARRGLAAALPHLREQAATELAEAERERNWAIDGRNEQRARAERAELIIHRVETLRCWTNEDGKRFVFADDLSAALGVTGDEDTR